MTVAELKKALENYPDDMELVFDINEISEHSQYHFFEIQGVETVEMFDPKEAEYYEEEVLVVSPS